jgi:hypothetical protein
MQQYRRQMAANRRQLEAAFVLFTLLFIMDNL